MNTFVEIANTFTATWCGLSAVQAMADGSPRHTVTILFMFTLLGVANLIVK